MYLIQRLQSPHFLYIVKHLSLKSFYSFVSDIYSCNPEEFGYTHNLFNHLNLVLTWSHRFHSPINVNDLSNTSSQQGF